MLHEQNEEELIENGVLEGLEDFMAQHTPKQIFECEKLRWKFMTPFLEPTLSRHLTVQKMGMFAIASLAYSGMHENYLHDYLTRSTIHSGRYRNDGREFHGSFAMPAVGKEQGNESPGPSSSQSNLR